MNSIIVHEYEKINEDKLKEVIPNYNGEFEQLVQFIEETVSTDEIEDAYRFMTVGKNREHGRYVSFKNYVGLVQLKSGLQIEILPKINLLDDNKTKEVFLKMLRSMKEFEGMPFNMSNLNVDHMNLYEVFINLYLQETSKLIKYGLKSSYVSEEDNLNFFKGKLIVKQQLKQNLVHKEKFYVSYDEYSLNTSENKLIKSTLLRLHNLSENSNNKKLCRQLLSHFELVNESLNYDDDFSKVVSNRNNRDYDTLMKWSKVFLKNKSFTTFSGNSISRALLFPMEKIFESYVAKIIKRNFGDEWNVTTQDNGYFLFDEPRKFKLKPDIVISRNDFTKIIMDTKWKILDISKENYGISQADMYQMYAYAKKYKTPNIWLLYPMNGEVNNHIRISFESRDDEGNKEAIVNLFFVDISNVESSINELKEFL
ncbi:MAG: McrC family protein [Erysipelotrichales bacterium]|nr:McrC family protein [Erysipelotrichales bacterium]